MIDQTYFQNKKVSYYTLGCKLNFAETSDIGKRLREEGFVGTPKGDKADLCIINTCSVTELADKKSRQTIRRIIKNNPKAFIAVVGCYAQLNPEEIEKIEGVDLVVGTAQKQKLFDHLGNLNKQVTSIIHTSRAEIEEFVHSCSQGDRTRYFLKVQDGCDYFCSYCTVPYARGKSRNGTIESLVHQAQEVALQGGKEIILTGVNIGDFGKTTGDTLLDLIKALDEVNGIERFRISSIEPNLLSRDIIEFVATSKRFAPHFHIPLQSGSNEVLQIMKRRYLNDVFSDRVSIIKKLMPHAFIGVDVIVGVHGETEDLFLESKSYIEKLPISQLHVFTYSERKGTKMVELEGKVSQEEKHKRSEDLINLSNRKLQEFYQSQYGRVVSVLFEHSADLQQMNGFSDNYVKVTLPYKPEWENSIRKIILSEESVSL